MKETEQSRKTTTTLTLAEFGQRAQEHLENAGEHPVVITRKGKPKQVVISYEQYLEFRRLQEYDTRRHIKTADLSEEDLDTIMNARVDPKFDHLNDLLK